MKKILNVLAICLLTTGLTMACPPQGDGDATGGSKAETTTTVEGTFASLNLDVVGMTCGGCENKVKAAINSIDGIVETKKVCSESDKASLTYDPSVTNEATIVKALTEKTGYSFTMVKSAGVSDAGAVKKSCSAECAKDCCKGKSAKSCTKSQKAACTKSQKAACTKSKAGAEKVLEKE